MVVSTLNRVVRVWFFHRLVVFSSIIITVVVRCVVHASIYLFMGVNASLCQHGMNGFSIPRAAASDLETHAAFYNAAARQHNINSPAMMGAMHSAQRELLLLLLLKRTNYT